MEKKRGLLLAVFLSLLLNCVGIQWGIPRNAYRDFYYAGQDIAEVTEGISSEYVQKSWEKSRPSHDGKIPRSVFNVIRSFHPDEHNIIKSLSNMSPRNLDFNPRFFEYPSFFIYFVGILLGMVSITGLVKVTSDISYYFAYPGEMGIFFLTGRAGVVLLSVLGVIFLYRAAENFFDRKTAFFSSVILAVTPLYVINSHFMTVDIPMVFWIILLLYFLSLFMKSSTMKYFYMACIAAGFAAGTKYPAFFTWLLLPLVYSCVKGRAKALLSPGSVKGFLLAVFAFFLSTPYAVFDFSGFKRDVLYQVETRGFAQGANPALRIPEFLSNSGVVLISGFSLLVILVAGGIIYALVKRGREKIFLAGLFSALLPIFLTGGLKYARYYLIILPFAAVLASSFIVYLGGKRFARHAAAKILLALLLAAPLVKSLSYSVHMSKQDIRIDAAEFIEENIPRGSKIIFTKDPWIFEVPPVNVYNYTVLVAEKGNKLAEVSAGSYLLIGELQYFLGYGSRKAAEKKLIEEIKSYGYSVEKVFKKSPGFFSAGFDTDKTIHDMVYTHPAVYLFKKI